MVVGAASNAIGRSYNAFTDVDAEVQVQPSPNLRAAASATENAEVEPKAKDIDEPWKMQLLLEFVRAVVPLTIFIVLYIGLLLGSWILDITLTLGLACIILGLAIFKYGLMVGLMPFGNIIGIRLPHKVNGITMCFVLLSLGILVTYSEPGINSLQLVIDILDKGSKGPGQDGPGRHLLLWVLSEQKSFQLLTAVAIGVGLAAVAGVFRLQCRVVMKPVIVTCLLPTLLLTAYCWLGPDQTALRSIVGLAWDCGAITTGPATVPIVLSLGQGIAQTNKETSNLDGFGIVTLASLIPVLTVLLFGITCKFQMDFHGLMPAEGEHAQIDTSLWNAFPFIQIWVSFRALAPLTFLLVLVQALVIREKPGADGNSRGVGQIASGIAAALVGLCFFNVGLDYGSIPLGEVAGSSLSDSLAIYSPERGFPHGLALVVMMLFGFVSGFIATIIDLEPCGLGEAVEHLSKGAFTKRDLFASVAAGVGCGIMLGFAKVMYGLDLFCILFFGYTLALGLSFWVDEGLCCIAWDSAGVTTGPVTVPLVLSMGLGLCNKVGSADGFGILACASVSPIISVLAASVLRTKICPHRRIEQIEGEERESPAPMDGCRGEKNDRGVAEPSCSIDRTSPPHDGRSPPSV